MTNVDAVVEPDLDRAFDLVMELMAIPGRSCQEGKAAEFVVERLTRAGVPADIIHFDTAHRRTPLAGECGNLILKSPGTQRLPRRMMSAHLDTVPICVGSKPVVRGKFVESADPHTGLGADDRAGVAVVLTAAVEIFERELPHPPLTFCWFVQEEIGLQGARLINRGMLGKPKLAFNWDGGSPYKLTIGATGGYRIEIVIEGIASHAGGAPERGVSAIAIAALAIADLQRNGWHGDVRKNGKHGTSNVGVIHGGEATNVVTDHVTVRAEARSHDPVFRKRILDEIEKAFRRAVREVKNDRGVRGKVELHTRLDYESFKLPIDEPCVTAAAEAVRTIGREPELAIANGGVDANWLTAHGIPAVTIGCGQLGQHMTTEQLDIAAFRDACRIGLRLATACQQVAT
ncbi:MAG: M20/M25/M40 family metallo-hydrolase [Pirellulaceae bacterium]